MRQKISVLLLAGLVFLLAACSDEEKQKDKETQYVAVFVPGLMEGSPTYKMMDQGARKAADKHKVKVHTVEAGFNQATWQDQLTALAAEGRYELILTSNPAMPEICKQVASRYPQQKFYVLEGSGMEHPQIASLIYNHKELAFMLGHFAALLSQDQIGLITGQEYPEMTQSILPGFLLGAQAVNPDTEVDFRVVGNWYDASKAEELARSMFNQGVEVILPIAGSANQGVIAAAEKAGKYVLWYDSPGFEIQPGVVAGSGLIHQEKAAAEVIQALVNDTLVFGSSRRVGLKEEYIEFVQDHELYKELISPEIREQQASLIRRMKQGEVKIPR